MGGFFGGILDSISGAVGGSLLGLGTSAVSNAQSAKAAKRANDFSAQQSQISRAYNTQQSQISRDYNSAEAGISRDFNAGQAQLDRDYQERMSNSSYQRAVGDLSKAGLNPMLSVMHQGASTPSGANANSSPATSHPASSNPARGAMAQTFGAAQNNAMNTKAIEEANSRIGLNNAAAAKNTAEAMSLPGYRVSLGGLADAQTKTQGETAQKVQQEVKNLQQQITESQARINSLKAGLEKTKSEALLNDAKRALTGPEADLMRARTALAQIDTLMAPEPAMEHNARAAIERADLTEHEANRRYYEEYPNAKLAEKIINLGSSFLSSGKNLATTRAALRYKGK